MPPRPLHSNIGNVNCEDSYNLGLRFEKYFNYYNADFTKTSTEKHQFIKQFVTPLPSNLNSENNHQQIQNLCKHLGGITLKYKTTTSLVTGMGQDHPLENGLLFHPTWGCPYIPGSSLKGALRAYFDNWLQQDEQKEATIQRIFGSDDTNAPAVGNYQFFDALPIDNVQLCQEEMTPHYGSWYAQGGDIKDVKDDDLSKEADKIPGDWHEPNPIQFLAIAKGTKFQFAIAPTSACKHNDQQKDLDLLRQALENQLTHFGLGAKTATGFGYFERILSAEETLQLEQEKQEKKKSGKQLLLSQLPEWQKTLIEQKEALIDDKPAFLIKNPNQLLREINNKHSDIQPLIIDYLNNNRDLFYSRYKRENKLGNYEILKNELKKLQDEIDETNALGEEKEALKTQAPPWQTILLEKGIAIIDDEPAFFIKNPNQLLQKINEYPSIENDIIIYLKANLTSLVHKYKRVNQMSSYNAAKKNLKKIIKKI
jgi:CRISPR-associated protein Cmr6